jgi:uncharacterized membrane protein YbhN (UPF0104 family)
VVTRRALGLTLLGLVTSAAGLLSAFARVHVSPLGLEPRVRLGELTVALAAARMGPFLVFVGLNASTLLWRAFQLQAAVRRTDGEPPRLGTAYHAVAVGHLAQNLLPARLGEGARLLALCRAEPISLSAGTAALVLGRVCDLLALLVTTCAPPLLLRLPAARVLGGVRPLAWLSLGAVGLVVLVALLSWLGAGRGRLLGQLSTGFSAVRSWRRLLVLGLSSLAIPLVVAASYAIGLFAFGIRLPTGGPLVLVAALFLAIAIPSAPASLGVYHAAVTFVLSALGADPPRTAAFALASHLVTTVVFIAVGAGSFVSLSARARARPAT